MIRTNTRIYSYQKIIRTNVRIYSYKKMLQIWYKQIFVSKEKNIWIFEYSNIRHTLPEYDRIFAGQPVCYGYFARWILVDSIAVSLPTNWQCYPDPSVDFVLRGRSGREIRGKYSFVHSTTPVPHQRRRASRSFSGAQYLGQILDSFPRRTIFALKVVQG